MSTRNEFHAFRETPPAQVHQWLRSDEAVLIDVREPDEHARERIKGATLMPLSRFDAGQAAAQARPGQRLVLHCRGGKRGQDACRMTEFPAAVGIEVFNLAGGIEAWKKAGLPVETNAAISRISVMRQVQLTVGFGVLISCSLAWLVHPGFVGLAAFFGAGLMFAGVTGTCGLAAILSRMPWNRASSSARNCCDDENHSDPFR